MRVFIATVSVMALALIMIVPIHGNEWVFTGTVYGSRSGPVNALIQRGDTILSGGADGFLEIWDMRRNTAVERFQVSPFSIAAMAGRPGRDELCLVESNTMGMYRISVWNYRERRNVFSLPMRDPIAYVAYSMGGNFIIAAGTGRTGLIFINATTGETIQSPQSLVGNIGLVVTGRTERNMVVYCASGELSYWDLNSGDETAHVVAPGSLRSPVLFSNNRYLAGINADGLSVINALSGDILAEDKTIPHNSLLCSSGDNLICLMQNRDRAELYRYTIDSSGNLNRTEIGQFAFSESGFSRVTAIGGVGGGGGATNGGVVLGTAEGSLLLVSANGQLRPLTIGDQLRITDAALSGSTIAFLAENGTMGFIPLNFAQLTNRRTLSVEKSEETINRVTAFAGDNTEGGQFMYWHDRNTRMRPVIRSSDPEGEKTILTNLSFRSPVRYTDSYEGRILFLDSTGNLSIVSPFSESSAGNRPFTFFSVGLMNAVFIDRNQLLIGRSAVSDNTPFMMINVNTGETVPLPYPARVGLMLHRGTSGSIYAAVINSHEAGGIGTSIIQFNPADSVNSDKLIDFRGEHTQFSFTESAGNIAGSVASTIGGEGAAIYSGSRTQRLARSSGFPVQFIAGAAGSPETGGGNWIISRDRDGSITWHDNRTGNILAIFRLHPNEWTLQTERETIRGGINRNGE